MKVVIARIVNNLNTRSIDFQFGSSPVSSLGVVSDLVVGFISEPVGQRSVLSLLLGESFLHEKGLVCTHLWIQILQLNNHNIIQQSPYPIPNDNYFIMMHSLELQRLTRQNQKQKNRLKQNATNIDCLNSDINTQRLVISKQKQEIEDLKNQIKILKRKLDDEQMDKENVQNRYLLVLKGLEQELDDYKKKYSKLQNKIVPLMDHDSVRLKILNQVEANHHFEISNLKSTIDNLKDQILKYRRENQVLKHSLQNQRMNHQQELRRIKVTKNNEVGQQTLNFLTLSMWKDMEAKLKHSYEQARKEAQFYKQKYFASEKKYQNFMLSPQRRRKQQQI